MMEMLEKTAAKRKWVQGDNGPLRVKGSALIGFGAKPQSFP